MSDESNKTNDVKNFYDAVSVDYHGQYSDRDLTDIGRTYPANYFRLQILLNSFVRNGVRRVIEVGVGEGTPLLTLAGAGIEVAGFDISEEMASRARKRVVDLGAPESAVIVADIQDAVSYAPLLADGQYDALMAMGVMPHVRNDDLVLGNMNAMIKPGGRVFIEFRNSVFSLFTFNRYTYSFIVDELLSDVSPQLRERVGRDLEKRLEMDLPRKREAVNGAAGVPGYDAIQSRFHNPLDISRLFERNGFEDIEIRWYHYHPAMPHLSGEDEVLFRNEALALEHESSGWKGLFLCSAFVVEAVKTQ